MPPLVSTLSAVRRASASPSRRIGQTVAPPQSLEDADLFAASTDSAAYAWAESKTLSQGTAVNIVKTLTAITDEQAKGDPSFAVTSSPAETPNPIAGADGAAYTVSTYTGSSSGRTHVQITVAANRSEQISIFQIDTYAADFAQNQEQIWQIVDSLQLNSPPTPSTALSRQFNEHVGGQLCAASSWLPSPSPVC